MEGSQNMLIEGRTLALFVFIVSFSLPTALLLNFLAYHVYSPFTPETIILFLGFGLFSMASAGLAWAWRPAGLLLISLVLLYYLNSIMPFDQIIAWLKTLSVLFKKGFPSIWSLIPPIVRKLVKTGIVLIIPLLVFLFIRKLGALGFRGLAAATLVILATTLITTWISTPFPRVRKVMQPHAGNRLDLPALIYIIFDEHMSIKWTPKAIPNARTAKQDMLKFYDKYGFLLFTNAFSRYSNTLSSISNALNFSAESHAVGLVGGKKTSKFVSNKVFEILEQSGYRIRVYQTQYFDFCDSSNDAIEFCLEYGANSIGDLQDTNIPTVHKTLLILGHWLSRSRQSSKLIESVRLRLGSLYGKDLLQFPIVGAPYNRVGPLNVMPAMERLRADVTRFPRGTAFFAHFLIPHFPYVYDAQCTLKKDPRTWLGINWWYGNQERPPDEEQYQHYYKQLGCLYKWLDEWFDELQENGILNDTVIVFHGDHGSKISVAHPSISMMSHQHWNRIVRDAFSTLFAVKAYTLTRGRVELAKPIDILLKEFFLDPKKLIIPAPESAFLLLGGGVKGLKKHNFDQW